MEAGPSAAPGCGTAIRHLRGRVPSSALSVIGAADRSSAFSWMQGRRHQHLLRRSGNPQISDAGVGLLRRSDVQCAASRAVARVEQAPGAAGRARGEEQVAWLSEVGSRALPCCGTQLERGRRFLVRPPRVGNHVQAQGALEVCGAVSFLKVAAGRARRRAGGMARLPGVKRTTTTKASRSIRLTVSTSEMRRLKGELFGAALAGEGERGSWAWSAHVRARGAVALLSARHRPRAWRPVGRRQAAPPG
jgi:hypothetical protein